METETSHRAPCQKEGEGEGQNMRRAAMKGGKGGGPPQMWEVPPAALELPGLEGAVAPSRQAKSTEKSN